MIRVVIADDHQLVREGIRALLERSGEIAVVGEANDGREAVDMVLRLAPDVLVMDIAMPEMNGMHALEALRKAGTATRIVILSMYSDEVLVREALRHGVNGFLPKGAVSDELLFAIGAAHRGAVYLSPAIPATVLSDLAATDRPAPPGAAKQLTARERQLLALIGKGQTNNQIAAALGISVKTVERHRTHLMQKLDAHNLAELIRNAIRNGLMALDD
jgi:DNA-binding NarL/FixJ family response regulator